MKLRPILCSTENTMVIIIYFFAPIANVLNKSGDIGPTLETIL